MENEIAPPTAFKSANPGPLGLAGFGLTTVVLSCVNAGMLPPTAVAAVVPLAFAYGGVAQLIAGVLEFKTGNTFGMVAFTSYGLFWWWFAFLKWTIGAGWLQAPPAAAVAATLLMWGIFTFLLWIVSLPPQQGRLERLPSALDHLLLARQRRLRLLHRHLTCAKIGGYLGLLTGIDALLVAFIEVLNATAGREVVSLGRPIIRN